MKDDELHSEMEHALTRRVVEFVHVLRRLGLRVSTAETLDALNALSHVEILNKSQFKGMLRASLVKNRAAWNIFEIAFERFFTTMEEKALRQEIYEKAREERQKQLSRAEEELYGVFEKWKERIPAQYTITKREVETFARMPRTEKERLKAVINNMQGNPVNNPGELIGSVLYSSLNYWRRLLKEQAEKALEKQVGESELTGISELDEVIEGVSIEFYREPEEEFRYTDLQEVADSDLERVTSLIQKMSRRMSLKLSRRFKRSSGNLRGVDIRRTMRRNMRYGGIPIVLSYRARRRRTPKVVLFCDVSASMARYARFIIQFIYGLSSALKDVETFIFSEDLEWVGGYFQVSGSFTATMASLIQESGQWGRTTNLCKSLNTFHKNYQGMLTKEEILIIVSDAKTILPEESAIILTNVKRRVKEVFWLMTAPVVEWENIPGARIFNKHVRMYECCNLHQLEQIIRRRLFKGIKG